MIALTDFLSLLRSSDTVPHRLRLSTVRSSEEATVGWVMTPVVLAPDPEGLCIERHGSNVCARHGDREVFRRSEQGCWVFQDGSIPTHFREQTFAAFGGAAAFLDTGAALAQDIAGSLQSITEESHLGREVWTASFSMPDATITVDNETGVLLAVSTSTYEVVTSEFELLESIPATTWTGAATEYTHPAPQRITETPQELPPLQNELRVRFESDVLEGAVFPFTAGEWTRQNLRFAPETRGSSDTYRVTVLPTEYTNGSWHGYVAGYGWTATIRSSEPLHGDMELTGQVFALEGRPTPPQAGCLSSGFLCRNTTIKHNFSRGGK